MKKILLSVVVMLALTAGGQTRFVSRSFIPSDLASIQLTNTVMLTNLATAWVGAGVTNFAAAAGIGIIITNQYGTRTIIQSAATGNTRNLLQDVPLWSLRDGSPPYQTQLTNYLGAVDLKASYVGLAFKCLTGGGMDQTVTLTFTPILNGKDETTVAAEEWSVSFPTAVVNTTYMFHTNVPVWRWPSASGLRLRRTAYTDTTAASTLTVLDLSLNGYVAQ